MAAAAGRLVLLPLALLVEGAPPTLTGRNLLGFVYLGLFGTALAYLLWFDGIRRLPAVAPPLLGLAAPITGAVLGWVVLGEDLSPLQLVGFAVTFGAIGYGAFRSDRPVPAGHGSQDGHDGPGVREHLEVTATGVPGRSHRGNR